MKKEKIGNKNYLIYKNVYYIITSMDNENQIIKIKSSYTDKNSYSEKDIISLNFSNACTLFSHIYLNWNPDIFKYHYKFNSNYIHNSTYYSKAYNEDYSLEYNPQFILEIPKHNENIEIKIFIEKFIHESIYINDDISYKLFRYDGYVKIYPEDDLRNYQKEKGNIASDTLFFEPSEVDEQFLIVIVKKDKNNFNKCEISINFSLNIFSQFPLKICEIPKRKLYLKEKQICKWNDHQLFDNKQIELLYDNFLKFPQFKLTLNSIHNKMIEILGRNSFNSKDTSNFDILSLIGKYFFNNIIKLFLYDEKFIVMLDFYPSSLYAKNNLNLMKTIISFLQNGDLFSLNNHPNLIPFNALFLNELLPKLYNFYKSLTNIPFSPYLEELISGKIKEYDFSYNFFERNPDDIFRNMSICFNINNYHSFLTLFKSYTTDTRDRKDFYKRGDKNCINNMRQYFGSSSDYKEFTNFTNQNQNKNPNIFHLYYKNISKDFDLGNEKNDSQIVFYIPEKNLQEIESQEDFRKNEIIKMKNRLCLLLYKIGDLEEENILDEDKKDLYNMIKKVISISKDEVIGKTLQILIDKIIFKDKENNDFDYTFFKDLEEGIQKYSDELEDSYSKMNKANENLRSITLNIGIIHKNNDLLLIYNSYLDLEKTLEEKEYYQTDKKTSNNFTQFLEYFSTIKDDKLESFYNQRIVDSFLTENIDFGKDTDNNPKTVNILHNYIINASEGKDQYMNVVSDFISSRVYDMLIYKEPDLDDIKLYKYLIGNKNNFEEFKDKIEPDHKTLRIMISLFKKFIKFRGVYQKILSLSENLRMFQNHHDFIKGKKDPLERDGIINYFTYAINKTYFNSYIRKAKYCLLFAVGQGNTESLNGTLSFMINHI